MYAKITTPLNVADGGKWREKLFLGDNSELTSCLLPLFQNESSCKTFIWKCVPLMQIFLIKGFARGLVLKQRHKVTRKWPSGFVLSKIVERWLFPTAFDIFSRDFFVCFVVFLPKVEIRPMMYLALTYDHRLIDGREAVTFLRKIKASVEDPHTLLLDF